MTIEQVGAICKRLTLPPGFKLVVMIENDQLRKYEDEFEFVLYYETKDANGGCSDVTVMNTEPDVSLFYHHDLDVAAKVQEMLIAAYVHEVNEWLRIDGKHYKDPHPELHLLAAGK